VLLSIYTPGLGGERQCEREVSAQEYSTRLPPCPQTLTNALTIRPTHLLQAFNRLTKAEIISIFLKLNPRMMLSKLRESLYLVHRGKNCMKTDRPDLPTVACSTIRGKEGQRDAYRKKKISMF